MCVSIIANVNKLKVHVVIVYPINQLICKINRIMFGGNEGVENRGQNT